MCGLTGIVRRVASSECELSVIETMTESIVHRGPDQGATWSDDHVALGHRRLSIIDLSEAGRQPMVSSNNKIVIVFNGEIYNFKDIRSILEVKGYGFKSHTDTEVILNAWQEWDIACLDYLRGMFAFAIYDQEKKQVFLARDRLGIKPLYYKQTDSSFAFASELKALKKLNDSELNLDPHAIMDYFCLGYIPDPKSIYQEIRKLEAGHYILLDESENTIEKKRYWKPSFSRPPITETDDSLSTLFLNHFDDAVESHLIADVPLGAFLSGGVDSSSVVASMSTIGIENIKTCSIGFDHSDYDESQYAQIVAEKYHTAHQQTTVMVDDFELVSSLIKIFDEPFADSSALPTYRVCEAARKHVTVCVSGDGGDELLAGYRRHRFHMKEAGIRQHIPPEVREPLFGTLHKIYPKLDWAPQWMRAKATFRGLAQNSVEAYFNSVSQLTRSEVLDLLSKDFVNTHANYHTSELFHHHAREFDGKDELSLIQYIDLMTWLPGDILVKTDRTSMAHSLEVRVPFLDHKFVDWCTRIPSHYRLHGNEGKYVLKRAMESRLPKEILYRRKKGFDVPISSWFRDQLKTLLQDKLLRGKLPESGIFNIAHIENLIKDHVAGIKENTRVLWALLIFAEFLEI